MATARAKSRKRKLKDVEVPFAVGFHPPTPKQSINAIGISPLPIHFEPGPENAFFQMISQPCSIDDWLAQYKEEGQSYKNFLRICPWISGRKVKYMKQKFVSDGKNIKERYPDGKIYLQPLGEFDSDSSPSVDDLRSYAKRFYSLSVVILPPVKLKLPTKKGQLAYCELESTKSLRRTSPQVQCKMQMLNYRQHNGHIQLKVDSILDLLQRQIPDDALCLIGLTMTDLYEEEPDLFVAGMAAGNQRVAVFSFARYDPSVTFSTEFWYDIWPTKQYDVQRKKLIILQRSCKLLVHEIAHLFGFAHCVWYSCCMNGSGHLSEDFAQPIYLCPVDLHKLQSLCGFDIFERYQKLLEFFKKHKMTEEAVWFEKQLHFITDGR